MPIYSIQGPTGQMYKIEGPAGATDAQLIATLQQHLATQAAPKKGVFAAGQRGLESLISSGKTALGALTGSPEEAAKAGLARQRQISEEYADPASLERVKKAYEEKGLFAAGKEALGQIPGAITEQLPQLGAMAGGARLGATAGSFFGPVGSLVGGTAGAVIPSLISQFGGDVERQAAEQEKAGQPVDINRAVAGAAAAPQAALDVIGTFIPFGGKLISKITGIPVGALLGKTAAQTEKLANERLLTVLAKGTAVGALAEIPTEIAQQMLERAQAGLSLSSPEAMKEYGETAYSVGLLAPLGAAGRVSQRSGARSEVAAAQQAEQAKAAAQQAEQAKAAAEAEVQRKASPEYLLQLDQQYTTALDAFNTAKKAVGKKPGKDATDDEKDAHKERVDAAKQAQEEYKAIREEHKAVRPAIAQAKEQARVAGMSEQDYYYEQMGMPSDAAIAASKAQKPEQDQMDAFLAQTAEIPQAPKTVLETGTNEALAGLLNNNQIYPMSDVELRNGAIEILMRNPTRAQAVVENDLPLPGFSDKESRTIRSALRLQLKALPKAKLAEEKGAIQRMGAETRGKAELEKTAGLFGDIAEQESKYQEAASEERTEQLAGDLGGALSRASREKAPGISVEEGLQKQNYNTKADEFAKAHEEALFDLDQIREDLAIGRFLDSEDVAQRKLASSTSEGLNKQAEDRKQAYIDGVLQEAANRRAAQNMQPITKEQVTKAVAQMTSALNSLISQQKTSSEIKRTLDVVRAQLAVATPQLQRLETPFRRQGAAAEAEKIGEARGETAKTLEGQLRRKRDYVAGIIERALTLNLKSKMQVEKSPLRKALVAAQEAAEDGTATNELLDAAEDAASRLLRGQSTTDSLQPLNEALRSHAQAREETTGAQGEMFGTEDLGAIRKSAAMFKRFLSSAAVAKLRAAITKVTDELAPAVDVEFYRKRIDTLEEQIADAKENLETLGEASWEAILNTEHQLPNEVRDARRKLVELMSKLSAAEDAYKVADKGPGPKGQLRRIEQARSLKQKLADKEYNLLQAITDLTKQLRIKRADATYGPLIKRFEKEAADFDAKAATLREALPETGRANPELDELFNAVADIEAKISETRATIAQLRERAYGPKTENTVLNDEYLEKATQTLDKRTAELRAAAQTPNMSAARIEELKEQVVAARKAVKDIKKERAAALNEPGATDDMSLLAAADERIAAERAEVKAMQEQLAKIDIRTYDQRQQADAAAKKRAELAQAEQQLDSLKSTKYIKASAPKPRTFGVRVERSSLTSRLNAVETTVDSTKDTLTKLREERDAASGRAKSGLTKKINRITEQVLAPLEEQLERVREKLSTTVKPIGAEKALPVAKEGVTWKTTKPAKPAIAEVTEPTEEKTPKASRVSREENIADIKSIAGVMARQGSDTRVSPRAKQGELRARKPESELSAATKKANAIANKTALKEYDAEFADITDRIFRESRGEKLDYGNDEGPEGGMVYRAKEEAGRGMDKAAVEALVAEHTKDWKRGPQIIITEAPREAGNASGGLSDDGSTMYIYYDKVVNAADVKATVFHEGLGHFGLRDIFKKKLDGVLNAIYKTNKDMRLAADAWLKNHPKSYTNAGEDRTARAVEEVLAIHSESGIKDASLWARIKAVVRAFARRMGLSDLAYTNDELDAIVARAHQRVMQSGELGGALISELPAVYRAKTTYASDDDLSKLAGTIIAQPKSFSEKAGKFYSTELEMQTTDMRAGLRRALEAGAKALGDSKLFVQAMFSVTKADQKMSVVQAALANGPMRVYTDDKGLKGIKSNNEGGAKEIFEAMSEIPNSYGNEAAKVNITSTYFIARRAMNKGLSKLDIGALGVTEEQLAAAMRVVENDPALKAALEKTRKLYNTYNRGLINGLAETGTITKAEAAEFLKDEDYVPFYRVRDNGMAELVFGGEKIITIGDIRHQPYLAELKGGETKILPLNESLQRNTLLLTDKMITNMAQRNVAYALQAYGASQDKMKINKGKAPAGNNVFSFMQEPKEGDRKDTGERWIRVETNDTMLDGIPAEMIVKSLDGAHLTLPAFLKWGSAAGDLLRSGVTRTPLYLMRQLFRDPMVAAFTSGLDYGPMKAIFKANKAFLDLSRGQSETGAKLIEKGLIQSGIFTGDPDDMAKFSLQLASGKSQGAIDRLFAMMDRAAMNADAATRTLVYDNAIKNGLSEVEADFAVMESMNFHKRGLSPTIQYASRMIPFFNAQIQGLNVLYKAARGQMPFEEQLKIKQKFVKNAVLLMGIGIAYAMAMDDDDYYKNAKPKDRYSNFFVHIPGVEEPLKLPIPYEAGWFFSIAVAMVDAMKGTVDNEQQFTALKDMFVAAIPGSSSMMVPQIVKPVAEVWTNKVFYSGKELESPRLQRLDPVARYNANTTETAKALSKMGSGVLSPLQIEHLASGYLGQLPIMAMAAADNLFTPSQDVPKPETRASELPLVGSAFQRKQGGDEADVAYRIAGESLRARDTYNNYAKSGNKAEAKEYLAEHKPEIAAAQASGSFIQLMGELRTREANIRGKDIPSEEKRARLDKLEEIRRVQAERFVKVLKKIETDVEKRTLQ